MNANLVVKASAGTGKTFSIATRFIQLLVFGNADPKQILALTFSRAAASEIYAKILERLWTAAGAEVVREGGTAAEIEEGKRAAAEKERKQLLDDLLGRIREAAAEAEKKGDAEGSARLLAEAAAAEAAAAKIDWSPAFFAGILRRVLDAQHHSTIATLDSFIQRAVRGFPLELGFGKPLSVLDGFGETRAAEDAVRTVLETAGGGTVDDLRAAQGGAAARTCRPRVLAAAKRWNDFLRENPGAGDWTAASMATAFGLAADLAKPDLSAIPVSGKASDARAGVVERAEAATADSIDEDKLFAGKPGELMKHLLEHPEATCYSYTTDSGKTVEYECGPAGAEAVRAAARHLAALALYRRLAATAGELRLAAAARRAFEDAAKKNGALTFSGFTDSMAAPEGSAGRLALENLQYRLDARFDHWALDEFQDTSMPQWDCLRGLVEEAEADGSRSVMAVGDFKQSIYRWRGGNDKPFADLVKSVKRSGGAEAALDISFRYGQNTADFVNAVFNPGNVRDGAAGTDPETAETCKAVADLWKRDGWPEKGHQAAKKKDGSENRDDFVEVSAVPPPAGPAGDEDEGGDGDDEADDMKPSAGMRVLAEAVCKRVAALWDAHEAAESTESVAVLVRKNADGLYLAEKLRSFPRPGKKPVPVVWEGKGGVLDAPAVRAVVELLSLAEHPEDEYAWRVANTLFPVRKTVFPELDKPERVSAGIARLLSRLGLARTIRHVVSGLKAGPAALDERSSMRLDELVRMGVAFESRPDATGGIGAFRRFLAAGEDRENASSPDVVRILTIHRSKGLTLDRVVVPVPEKAGTPGLADPGSKPRLSGEGWVFGSFPAKLAGVFPTGRAAWKESARDGFLEALRTWYVALTRARKSTHVLVMDGVPPGCRFRDLVLAAKTPRVDPPREEAWGRVLCEIGTMPDFGKKTVSVRETAEWKHVPGEPPVEHRTPSAPSLPVSAPHGGRLPNPFGKEFGANARKGVEEHAAYAAIKWIDPAAPKDERERKILDWGGKWRDAFLQTPGATVWRERSYEIFDGETNRWETGQFDRVVFRGDGADRTAEIYDFKTNENREKTVAAFEEAMREKYAGQMADYRRAVSRLTGIPESSVTSALLLADTGTSVEA